MPGRCPVGVGRGRAVAGEGAGEGVGGRGARGRDRAGARVTPDMREPLPRRVGEGLSVGGCGGRETSPNTPPRDRLGGCPEPEPGAP